MTWTFKTHIEKPVRQLDRFVEGLFHKEMLAAGYKKRGRTWKKWRDIKPVPAPMNIKDVPANTEFAQAARASILAVREELSEIRLLREQSARAELEAHPEWWPEIMEFAEGLQSDLISYICRDFSRRDLEMHLWKTAEQMRQELGAVTRLEKLLVEYMIVARLYGEDRTDANPKAAQRRVNQAAQMLETARRLLGSGADSASAAPHTVARKVADHASQAAAIARREAEPAGACAGVPASGVHGLEESTHDSDGTGAEPPEPPGALAAWEIPSLDDLHLGGEGSGEPDRAILPQQVDSLCEERELS